VLPHHPSICNRARSRFLDLGLRLCAQHRRASGGDRRAGPSVTVKEIAQQLDVAPSMIYAHFPGGRAAFTGG
jgi:hypothetical protein